MTMKSEQNLMTCNYNFSSLIVCDGDRAGEFQKKYRLRLLLSREVFFYGNNARQEPSYFPPGCDSEANFTGTAGLPFPENRTPRVDRPPYMA